MAAEEGSLFVVATPIGNLEDITLRAMRVLGELDALACEDTRRTRAIYEHYDLPRPRSIFSYHRHNEAAAGGRILALLARGESVGLVSNAGYPCISDPGHLVVRQAIEAGHRVEVIPGASAVPHALIVSGLPTGAYLFLGFPPRKAGRLQTALTAAADGQHTLVLFEAPGRLTALLQAAVSALGDRLAAGCIELTKRFEQVHRGYLTDLIDRVDGMDLRGEVCVVIAGNDRRLVR
ncbi:MAG: 16S rRNA (cytidine(1402)-2'-O)-methyltransferase [Spirochaetaceae bacterium]|nr:16S rRNA (cytidine(1402)-2'-O)-methyltransferase [Spirochaetaceae bacterium]